MMPRSMVCDSEKSLQSESWVKTGTHIRTFEFQPFESRQGRDTVIGLTFPFNRPIAEILKQCFARYRQQVYDPEHFIHSAGGWLTRERCWFVEHAIWPTVQRELEAAGYEIHSQCGATR